MTFISWSNVFAFYLEDNLIEKCHTLDISLYDTKSDLKIYVGQSDLSNDYALQLEDCLIENCHALDISSMWQ